MGSWTPKCEVCGKRWRIIKCGTEGSIELKHICKPKKKPKATQCKCEYEYRRVVIHYKNKGIQGTRMQKCKRIKKCDACSKDSK